MPNFAAAALQTFAQADNGFETISTSYEADPPAISPFDTTAANIVAVVVIVLAVIAMVGLWRVFRKAGKPGWWAAIPVFNLAKLFEMLGKPAWWGLLVLGSTIPWVGYGFLAAALVLLSLANFELGKRFGKSINWSVIYLCLFGFVGINILGFGKSQYRILRPIAPVPPTTKAPVLPGAPTAGPSGPVNSIR